MDHLLRTLAAVSPQARILYLGSRGASAANIARLGFETWASGGDTVRDALAEVIDPGVARERTSFGTPEAFPDAWFDWVAADADGTPTPEALYHLARVLRPGGWVWVAAPGDDLDALNAAALGVGLAVAERVAADERDGKPVVRGIFRRVGDGVTG